MAYNCDIILDPNLSNAVDICAADLTALGVPVPVKISEMRKSNYLLILRFADSPDVSNVFSAPSLKAILLYLREVLDQCSHCTFMYAGHFNSKFPIPDRSWDSFENERRKIGWNI